VLCELLGSTIRFPASSAVFPHHSVTLLIAAMTTTALSLHVIVPRAADTSVI